MLFAGRPLKSFINWPGTGTSGRGRWRSLKMPHTGQCQVWPRKIAAGAAAAHRTP